MGDVDRFRVPDVEVAVGLWGESGGDDGAVARRAGDVRLAGERVVRGAQALGRDAVQERALELELGLPLGRREGLEAERRSGFGRGLEGEEENRERLKAAEEDCAKLEAAAARAAELL